MPGLSTFLLVKYLPFLSFTIFSKLSSEEILERLDNKIEHGKNFQNSLVPLIKGEVMENENETEIKVHMRPHLAVLVIMTMWVAGLMYIWVSIVVDSFGPWRYITGTWIYLVLLILLAMLIFGTNTTLKVFKRESLKAKNFLEILFEAKEIKS